MAKDKLKVQVYTKGSLLCEPLVDMMPDPTHEDRTMLVFPDFNIFAASNDRFTTKAGERHYPEGLRPGFYVWVDWEGFNNRGDACLHWSNQTERIPIEEDTSDLPPIAG